MVGTPLGLAQIYGENPKRCGGPGYVHQGTIPCKDGLAFLFIGGRWEELKVWMAEEGIDIAPISTPEYDVHTYDVLALWTATLREKLQELGSRYSKTEFMLEAQRRKIPIGAMETIDTLLQNQHFVERGFFEEIHHPKLGTLKYTKAPARFSAAEQVTDRPAPLLGADTERILDSLGYSRPVQQSLREAGVI